VIAGIMENFHYQSLRSRITPAFLFIADSWRNDDYRFVRARAGQTDAVLGAVRDVWTEVMPPGTFDYIALLELVDCKGFDDIRLILQMRLIEHSTRLSNAIRFSTANSRRCIGPIANSATCYSCSPA
jgi:hypothetical protein